MLDTDTFISLLKAIDAAKTLDDLKGVITRIVTLLHRMDGTL